MKTTDMHPEIAPPSELPIWAWLKIMSYIPRTYMYDHHEANPVEPVQMKHVKVIGFRMVGQTAWIYWSIDWPDGCHGAGYLKGFVRDGYKMEFMRDHF